MKKIVGLFLMLVLSVYLILMFINMSEDYDKVSEQITFTTIENTANEEVILVHQLINEITDIHIDGIHYNVDDTILSINTIEDGSIIFIANVTGIGEEVVLDYNYQVSSSEFTSSFIEVVPLIMIMIVLGGFGYAVFKFN